MLLLLCLFLLLGVTLASKVELSKAEQRYIDSKSLLLAFDVLYSVQLNCNHGIKLGTPPLDDIMQARYHLLGAQLGLSNLKPETQLLDLTEPAATSLTEETILLHIDPLDVVNSIIACGMNSEHCNDYMVFFAHPHKLVTLQTLYPLIVTKADCFEHQGTFTFSKPFAFASLRNAILKKLNDRIRSMPSACLKRALEKYLDRKIVAPNSLIYCSK